MPTNRAHCLSKHHNAASHGPMLYFLGGMILEIRTTFMGCKDQKLPTLYTVINNAVKQHPQT